MQDRDSYRNTPSILATLECLPEVVETSSESAWQLFLALQSGSHDQSMYSPTQPSGLRTQGAAASPSDGPLTVQAVMAEARRLNRVAPCAPEWQRLHALLKSAGCGEPPSPFTGPEASAIPPLVQRMRIRDQVEWAAQRGLLQPLFDFLQSLPENRWMHMGR